MTLSEQIQKMNEPEYRAKVMAELRAEVKAEISKFNEPYKPAVAINCIGIGDDNDYSIFLSSVIYALMDAGKKEMALTLANTDPMRDVSSPLTMEQLEDNYQHHQKFVAEQAENEAHYYRFYKD